MATIWTCSLILALGIGAAPEANTARVPKGWLVVAGGGKPSDAVKKRTLALAGGLKAKVVVIPQASDKPGAGPKAVLRWRSAGAEDVAIVDLDKPEAAIEAIRHANLIWISGGDQERLMRRLRGTDVPAAIYARYREGATVGGASAGAAVMSKIMIARGRRDFAEPRAVYPVLGEGLGLWPGVIVDQHFLKRNRTDRLRRAVAEHPDQVGVGIDESTAVIVTGRRFEVVGDSRVMVFDGRAAEPKAPDDKGRVGGGDGHPPAETHAQPKTATLDPGMIYDLDRGIIPDQAAVTP